MTKEACVAVCCSVLQCVAVCCSVIGVAWQLLSNQSGSVMTLDYDFVES